MKCEFNIEDIEKISNVLNCTPEVSDNTWIWKIVNHENKQSLILTLHKNIPFDKNEIGCLVSVQTLYGYYELHNPIGYMIFEPDEVIFIQANEETISSIIVGKQSTCSVFANIKRDLINKDFKELDPAILLSVLQLSITEAILNQ